MNGHPNEVFQVYDLYLDVQGPVFVGCGKQLTKKEYLFRGDQMWVIDVERFYSYVRKKGMASAFERYLLDPFSGSLNQWLTEMRINAAEIQPYLQYAIGRERDTVQYNGGGRYSGYQGSRKTGRTEIHTFVKDAFGLPYVPGSSVKGMLRTILFGADLLQRQDAYAKDAQQVKREIEQLDKRRGLRSMKQAEHVRFHTLNQLHEKPKDFDNAVNDELSGLIVSDSDPLALTDLTLCPKIDVHVNGAVSALPMQRECLKPGTRIHCTLTVDRTKLKLTGEEITRAAQVFLKRYNAVFAEKFGREYRLMDGSVLLGGGSGFVSKTVLYDLFSPEEGLCLTKTVFDRTTKGKSAHKSERDRVVSPRVLKCTTVRGKTYQFGVCKLQVKAR